jgi:hypothetical protein
MKKLFIIAFASIALLTGIGFADFSTFTVSPADQVAMSWTLVSLSVQITNNTGDAYVVVKLPQWPNYSIAYQNASLLPINNALIQLGIDHDPIFTIASWATLTISLTGKMITTAWSFPATSIQAIAANDAGITTVFTSAVATITPIADLTIQKIITGTLPIFSGDLIHYIVIIQNIWSDTATGIQLADTFPIPLFNVPSAIMVGNPVNYDLPITYPNTFVWTAGPMFPLQPGQALVYHITAPLAQQVAPGTSFGNTATAITSSTEYTAGNNTATVTGQIGLSDLSIFTGYATWAQPEQSGDVVHFFLWYNNSGPAMSGQRTISISGTNTTWQISPYYFLANTTGTMLFSATTNANYAPGTQLCLTAVISWALENGPLTNNNFTVCTTVAPLADLYISKTMLPFTGFAVGSIVTYVLNYGNSWGKVISGVLITDSLPGILFATPTSRVIWSLQPGQTGSIILTGTLTTTLSGGTTFVNTATIVGNGIEVSTGNNFSSVTWTIATTPHIILDIQANNLTRPQYDTPAYGASGSDIMILAVSGDLVQLTINYGNNGNTSANSGIISLAGLGGFTSLGTYIGNVGNLNIGQTGTITITWIVGPQNYITFTPIATLTYNGTQTVSDHVTIQEPFVCGDGFITRTEPCDTMGQIGLTISGQVCENHGDFCVAVTKNIINTACIDYRFTLGSGHICSTVQFPIQEPVGQCKSLITHDGNIILAEENNGNYVGNADFTCSTDVWIAQTIVIDCGNGEIHTGTNLASFDATCHFSETSIPKNRTVQCYVDGTTKNDCTQTMIIDQAEFGRCGDGILQWYENCDLGSNNQIIWDYLDEQEYVDAGEYANGGYTCHNCDIQKEDVIIPQTACFSVNNNNISIQDNEILPFRWKVDVMGNDLSTDRNGDCTPGEINQDSMECEFRLFNGEHQESNDDPIYTKTVKCNTDERTQDGDFGQPEDLFRYFYDQRYTNNIRSLQDPFGRYYLDFTNLQDEMGGVYGEYNIALYQVRYEYCDANRKRVEGNPIDRVCETDFAVTKPYLAQKSSFGLTPQSTTVKLDDYLDIFGNPIIGRTDLDKIMVLDAGDYQGGSNVSSLMTSFINKYSKLAIAVEKSKVPSLNQAGITSIKIVPQQKIYILEGTAGTTVTLNPNLVSTTPFTIVTKNINLIVEGSLTTNGMFLVKGGTITFKEPETNRCKDPQVVQGIFVTDEWFASDPEDLRNNDLSKTRCPNGWLYVKGVLIWNNIEDLVASRRSQLNHWFYAGRSTDASVLAERRNEIFNGAAVLIEYSPSLRTALPPGATEFTTALDVYKK